MELIIVAVIAFVVGWKLNEFFHVGVMMVLLKELGVKEADLRRLADRHGIKLPDPDKDTGSSAPELEEIQIKVEKHGSEIYAFRADNDQFLGQGPDRESLITRLGQSMTNVRLTVIEGNEHMKPDTVA